MVESICGLNFSFTLVFTGSNSCGNCCDTGHSVFTFFQFCYCDVAGVDGDLIGCSIGFVFSDFVDMDGPLLSVYLDDFSFAAFSGSSEDDDLIVFSDWECSDSVFASESFGEGGGHDSVSEVRGCREMGFSLFSSAAANLDVSLHNYGSIINIILIFYHFYKAIIHHSSIQIQY